MKWKEATWDNIPKVSGQPTMLIVRWHVGTERIMHVGVYTANQLIDFVRHNYKSGLEFLDESESEGSDGWVSVDELLPESIQDENGWWKIIKVIVATSDNQLIHDVSFSNGRFTKNNIWIDPFTGYGTYIDLTKRVKYWRTPVDLPNPPKQS